MKIAVTGASGFLGSWICRVAGRLHEIHALTSPNSDLTRLKNIENLQIHKGDLQGWLNCLETIKPEALVMADWWGVGNLLRNDLRQYDNLNRVKLISAKAIEMGAKVVIGLGSQAEVGPTNLQISDSIVEKPTTHYGRAKIEARNIIDSLSENSDSRSVWLRILSTYGPLDHGTWLIPQTVDSLQKGKEMLLTKGEQEWSYLHAYDLATSVLLAVEKHTLNGIATVGNPQTVTLRDLIMSIGEIMGRKELLCFGAIPYRNDQVMKLIPDVSKLMQAGWSPRVNLDSGLSQTIDWIQGHQLEYVELNDGTRFMTNVPLRKET
jgi:UDP-glucose 4-epimerase